MNPDVIEPIAAAFAGREGVSRGRAFASDSLMVHDKIFALFRPDGMVFKLPAARCQGVVADGMGTPFTTGANRKMKEWVVVPAEHAALWPTLAKDAFAFVSAGAKPA